MWSKTPPEPAPSDPAVENEPMLLAEVEFWAVIVPIVLAVVLVIWVAGRLLVEGVGLTALPADRRFLIAFFYSGALVAIWLSCYYFYGVLSRGGAAPGG